MAIRAKKKLGTPKCCENCGDTFYPKTVWQKFCKDKCKMDAYYKRVTWKGPCPHCGETIQVALDKNENLKKNSRNNSEDKKVLTT